MEAYCLNIAYGITSPALAGFLVRLEMDESRLVRIEQKLDKLSEAVVSLARMEERMITLFKRMDSYEGKQGELEERVIEIEKISVSRGAVFRLIDKATWIVVGVVVALLIEMFAR